MDLTEYDAKKARIEEIIALRQREYEKSVADGEALREALTRNTAERQTRWSEVLDACAGLRRLEDDVLHGDHVTLAEERERLKRVRYITRRKF